MNTQVRTLEQLVVRLLAQLREQIEPASLDRHLSGHRLRAVFDQLGREACSNGFTLDETMVAAIAALREVFDGVDDLSDAAITMSAGSALTAVARGFREEQSDFEPLEVRADLASPQVEQLRALHRISRAVTTSVRPAEFLQYSVRVVARVTKSDACAVFLYNDTTDTLGLWAATGLNPASIGALSIIPGEGITGLAAEQRAPIVAADARHHPAWVEAHNFGDSVYASQASIPMMIEEPARLVGVLNVLSIERRDLPSDEIAFLRTVANELAVGVEFSRLRNQTDTRLRQKIAELGTLQRVSRTIASSLSLAEVLPLIAEAAAELINAEAAALYRLPERIPGDDREQIPVIEYRVGVSRRPVDEFGRDAFIQQVIESGVARAAEVEFAGGSNRMYCLPLRSARERWGALCIRLKRGAELSEDELAMLQAFTDSASIAIENAQLYREARNGVETASALLQEMHHRVRNNLQTLAALLSLQIRRTEYEQTAQQLREAAGRVQAIAAVHDLLSDEKRLSEAPIDAIARLVAEQASVTQRPPGLDLEFEIPSTGIVVPSRQATILALLINELVSNAIAHGFRGRESGKIAIEAAQSGGRITVRVTNNGHQLPEGITSATSQGLGLRIVERLAHADLGGSFSIAPAAAGTVAEITFPATSPRRHSYSN
jgi:two-component sensor histidine kinase